MLWKIQIMDFGCDVSALLFEGPCFFNFVVLFSYSGLLANLRARSLIL